MPDGMNLPVLDVVPANDRQNTSTSSGDLPVLDVVPAGTAQTPAQPAPDDLPVLDVVPAGTAPQPVQAAAGGDLPQLDVYAPSQMPGMMTPRSEMTPGVPMPAQTPLDPAGQIREMAGTNSVGRIWEAMQHGYEASPPGLTPEANAALENWPLGLGYPVKALGGLGGAGMGVLSGLFQGGLATAYETGTNLFGLPPALMRDFTGYLETGGMSGAPHYAMPPRVGPGFEALRDQSTIGGMVRPERQGFTMEDQPAPYEGPPAAPSAPLQLTQQPPIEWGQQPHTGPGDAPVTLDQPHPLIPPQEPSPPSVVEAPKAEPVPAPVDQTPTPEPGPAVPVVLTSGDNIPPSPPHVPTPQVDQPSPAPSPVAPPPPGSTDVQPTGQLSPRPGELPTNVDQPPPVVSPPEPSVVPASTERPTPVAADAIPPAVPRSELAEPQLGTQPERVADVKPSDTPLDVTGQRQDTQPVTEPPSSQPAADDVIDAARRRGPKDGGGPESRSNTGLPTLEDYQQAKGPSQYHEGIYRDAGHDPVAAVNYPVQRQVNIMQEQVQKGLGFRRVEIGKGQRPEEVRDNLADTYHGMQEVMSLLGRSHTSAGQNGQVTLRLEGPPKEGQPLGTYNRLTKVITLYGKHQVLGHEWAHAEDNMMVQRLTQSSKPGVVTVPTAAQARRGDRGMASILARTKGLDPTADVEHAIAHVMNTIYFDEADLALHRMDLEQRAQGTGPDAVRAQQELAKIEAGSSQLPIMSTRFRELANRLDPEYFGSPQELMARSREAHMAWKAMTNGADPRGVVMRDAAYNNMVIQGLRLLYPKENELLAQYRAWDNYDRAMEKEAAYGPKGARSTDPGVDLLLERPKTQDYPTLSQNLRGTINALKNFQKNFSSAYPFDSTRPVNERTMGQKAMDIARGILATKAGLVEVVRDRAMPEAKRHVQQLRDLIGYQAGTGRASGPNFKSIFDRFAHELTGDYASVLHNTGIEPHKWSDAEQKAFDRVLSGVETDTSTIPPEQRRAISGMRHVFNKAQDILKNEGGYEVGYLGNWRPRIPDRAKIDAEGPRFLEQTGKGYRRAFDEAMDQGTLDHAENILDAWDKLNPDVQIKRPLILRDIERLRDNLKEQQALERDIARNPANAPAILPQLTSLKNAAQAMAEAMHNRVGDFISEQGALDYQSRVLSTPDHEFHKAQAGGNYLKQRILPSYFDDYLGDFYDHNIAHWAPGYLQSVARATAKSQIFGPNWEKRNDLINKAWRAGQEKNGRPGLALGDDEVLRKQIERIVSPGHVPIDQRGFAGALNGLLQYNALLQLGRTPISILSEFATGAMTYGNAKQAALDFLGTMKQITRSGDAKKVADLANFIGVTQGHYHSEALLDRYMVDYASTPRLARIMDRYFNLSGMTPLTNATRRGGMEGHHAYARTMAADYFDGTPNQREDAVRFFNEHGAMPETHDRYAQWLRDHPTVGDIDHGDLMMDIHREVLLEGVNRKVLAGNPAHTPQWAEDYRGRLPFQFMNYSYQFQQNILKRLGKEAHFQGARAGRQAKDAGASDFGAGMAAFGGQAKVYGKFLGAVATSTLAQLPTTALRQLLYAPRQWDEHEKAGDLLPWLLETALQRTGVAGAADQLQQVVTQHKYIADVTSILDGSAINSVGQSVMDLFGPFIKPTSNTNTVKYDQARAAYNLFIAPAVALAGIGAGTALGPAGRLVAPGILQAGTSRAAADRAAEIFAGPRGTPTQTPSKRGTPKDGKLSPLRPLRLLSGDAKGKQEDKATQGSGAATGALLGVLDDLAQPMAPYAARLLGAIPGGAAVKAGVGAAALGGVIAKEYMDNAQYRQQPPRKPRH